MKVNKPFDPSVYSLAAGETNEEKHKEKERMHFEVPNFR